MSWLPRRPRLEPHLRERVRTLLRRRGLLSADLDEVFDGSDAQRREHEFVSPTAHLGCWAPATGRRYHLRVLAWREPEWRQARRRCIRDHQTMHRLCAGRRLPFRVPVVVDSGVRALIWDLTEYADGYILPWRGHAPERLQSFPDAVTTFTRIADSIEALTPRGVRRTDWERFRIEMHRLHRAGRRQGWLGERTAARLAGIIERELAASPGRREVLTHGDFNPTNVIFPYDGGVPWLIDWDLLHYSTWGAAFARLWMFTSNEPAWQASLLDALDNSVRSPDDWGSFLLFATYEVLRQCQHTFATDGGAPSTIDELQATRPAGARMVRMYRRNLLALLDAPMVRLAD